MSDIKIDVKALQEWMKAVSEDIELIRDKHNELVRHVARLAAQIEEND